MLVVFLAAIVAGLGLVLTAALLGRRDEEQAMADLLGLARQLPEVEEQEETTRAMTDRAVELAGQAVDRVDRGRALNDLLEQARIPLRPGEFVIVVVGGTLALAAMLLLVTSSALIAGVGAIVGVLLASRVLRRRVSKRKKAFEAQLPDALSLVASSLSAGHTFLRAVQMMCEESAPPLSEEFARLVAETRLGDNLIDALQRMAGRMEIRDLDMVVQAIRIQQTVGGRLADLFHTLADVIRSRQEVKREVLILTAEGRMSAYVLAGLVPFLFVVMRMLNPEYVQVLYSGKGLFVLVGCALLVTSGLFVILRMVKIDV